eukprot:IDg17970t1
MLPFRQEGKLFAAANADTLAKDFATIDRLIEEYDFDAARIWNLDETGGHLGKTFLRGCDTRPVLSIFKGIDLPYRNVARGSAVRTEKLSEYLPRGAVVVCVAERGGVDGANFFREQKRLSILWETLRPTAVSTIVPVAELQKIFKEKGRVPRSGNIGDNAHIDSSGFIDKIRGEVQISYRARALAREESKEDAAKRKAKDLRGFVKRWLNSAGSRRKSRICMKNI